MKKKLMTLFFITCALVGYVAGASAQTCTWTGEYTTVNFQKFSTTSTTISWTPVTPSSSVYAYKIEISGDIYLQSDLLTQPSFSFSHMYHTIEIVITAYGYTGTVIVARLVYANGGLSSMPRCARNIGSAKGKISISQYGNNRRRFNIEINHTFPPYVDNKHSGFRIDIFAPDGGENYTYMEENTTQRFDSYDWKNGDYIIRLIPKEYCGTPGLNHCLEAIITVRDGFYDENFTFEEKSS